MFDWVYMILNRKPGIWLSLLVSFWVCLCVCKWGNYKQENNLVENVGSVLFKLYFKPDCTLALGTPGMIPASN